MASIFETNITIKNSEYRPCIIKGEKCLFIRWDTTPIGIPVPLPDELKDTYAQDKRIVECTVAIAERENGTVFKCNPTDIRFVDNPFAEIAFPPETNLANAEKQERRKTLFEETRFDCPFCNTTEGAILCGDAEHKEYFVYCQKCEVETIESFKTPQAAVSAFKNGKTEKIRGSEK